jgi:methylase of polypeptide subunit release factors
VYHSVNFKRAVGRGRMSAKRILYTHFGIPYEWSDEDREIGSAIDSSRGPLTLTKPAERAWYKNIPAYDAKDFLGDIHVRGLLPPDSDWSHLPWSPAGAVVPKDNTATIVEQTAHHLRTRLTRQLLSLLESRISEGGGFLYYTDRVDRCLVYEYQLLDSHRAINVNPCAEIREPNVLYDIDSAITRASPEMRAALKGAVVYGHKIVSHRNIMVHVDRRRDQGTAGPSIDTIILNELLHKYIYEFYRTPEANTVDAQTLGRVLEIGSGSGMLISSAAKNLPNVKEFIAIDININALHCTTRNFMANNPQRSLVGICAHFSDIPLSDIDLAICNPPYIPRLPGIDDYIGNTSIAGTELLREVIIDSKRFLSTTGILLMIFSRLAEAEFDEAVSASQCRYLDVGPPEGFRVAFDVSEVFRDEEWRRYLCDERGLEYSEREGAHHRLRCVAVYNSPKNVSEDPMLARIKELASKIKRG